MVDENLKDVYARLEKLEKAVFGPGQTPTGSAKAPVGPKGGILLLISKGFFDDRRTARSAQEELRKLGFDYRDSVVRTALNRLSKITGPLTTSSEGGRKAYVKRK